MVRRAVWSWARWASVRALADGPPAAGHRPPREFLIALLGVGVAQPMQLGEPGPGGVAFVDPKLLDVGSVRRDE